MRIYLMKSFTLLTKKHLTFSSIAFATALFLAIGAWWVASQPSADAQSGTGHLITIYDRGTEQVLLSDGDTIADALKEASVDVDAHDVVEPALTEKMIASEYHINIYRARPVIVVDGPIRERVMTAHQTPEQIIKDAGVAIYPEDETKLQRSNDFIGDGAGLELTIDRATAFNFDLYGSTAEARTQGVTIGDMLKSKNIKLGENDKVSPDPSTAVTAGMSVRVWREGKQVITADEPVAFGTEQIRDADREYGYKAVQTPGVNGARKVTYEVEVQNGLEVKRTEIASITTTEPVKQIEVIGTKLPTPTTPTENQALGRIMMLEAGYGEDQWPCLYNLWTRESGWKTTAGNPSSGAYGIPQSLPASKMAAYGADYLTNARPQIAWGLNYIKGRYSTPCGAWESFLVKNWY
jgi:uncharacterized protein YabE (DUF348 family)